MISEFEQIHDLILKVITSYNEKEKAPIELPNGSFVYKAEMHTVVAIGNLPGINVTDLAAKLSITKGAISQMAKKLLKKQFILKQKDSDNDKEIKLYLSEKGKMLCKGHNDAMNDLVAEMESRLGNIEKDKIEFLIKFLHAVYTHISNI
jgi:DNA-binding MarR family transcriptional regulator